jgi:hypothetical protein
VRRISTGAGILAVAAIVATGCSSERDAPDAPLAFCKAAAEYDHQLSTKTEVPLRTQIRLVGDIVDAAPRAVADDARLFLRALEAVRTDDEVVDDPGIQRAVENVNRYAAQGCDFYARRSGI